MTDQDQSTPLIITTELPCRRCRQILYGLSVTMDCPECGLPIEETLRTSIDLESLHGQALQQPRMVASAVIAFALAATTSLGAAVLVPLTIATTRSGREGGLDLAVRRLAETAPALGILLLVAAAFATLGLLMFERPSRQFDAQVGHVRRWSRAVGLLLISAALTWVAVLAGSPAQSQYGIPGDLLVLIADLVLGIATIAVILALDGVLRVIGARSEQYRRAGRGVQSARPMIAGITISTLIGVIGLVMTRTSTSGVVGNPVEGMHFIRLALVMLLAVGGIYLLANAVWATAPFWRGPWRFDQVVGTPPSKSPASMADDPSSGDTG